MYKAVTVAQKFLALAREHNTPITCLQMQKLVYFAHGVLLAARNKPLIEEDVQAWPYGPVIPQLYNRMRQYGQRPVPPDLKLADIPVEFDNDADSQKAVRAVWQHYGRYTGLQLSQLTHRAGTPWHVLYYQRNEKFAVIPNTLTQDFYKKRVNANHDTA